MYIVAHSKDPYLLARLATELQMEGLKSDKSWNANNHPFREDKKLKWDYMAIYTRGIKYFNFHPHACVPPELRIWLTEKNYTEMLNEILKNNG